MTTPAPDRLVHVHTGNGGAGVAALVESMLLSEGIHSVIKSENGMVAINLVGPSIPAPAVLAGGLFDVFVVAEDEERAREILEVVEEEVEAHQVEEADE